MEHIIKVGALTIEKMQELGMFKSQVKTQELFDAAVSELAAKENFWNTIKKFYKGEGPGDKISYLDENVQVLVVVESDLTLLHNRDFLLTVLKTLNTKGVSALVALSEVGHRQLLDLVIETQFPPLSNWPKDLKEIFFKDGK